MGRRKAIPDGYSVQRKTGWDKDKESFRLTVDLTKGEYELIKEASSEDGMFMREWIKRQAVDNAGSNSNL